jgi:hypothetical protein
MLTRHAAERGKELQVCHEHRIVGLFGANLSTRSQHIHMRIGAVAPSGGQRGKAGRPVLGVGGGLYPLATKWGTAR